MTAPALEYPTEPCRSCGQPVIWCITERLQAMPVDAEPVPDGNIQLVARPVGSFGGRPLAKILNVAQRFGKTNLHTSHFVDCPQAAKWRTRKAKTS